MKLLAEKIAAQRFDDPALQRISDRLRLPAENHAALAEPLTAPRVERYVFGRKSARVLEGVFNSARPADRERWMKAARAPHDEFFVEFDTGVRCLGYYYQRLDTGKLLVEVLVRGRLLVVPFMTLVLVNETGADDEISICAVRDGIEVRDEDTLGHMLLATLLLAVLSSHHIVDTRRIVPKAGRAVRRRFQRGDPVFSHNKVRFLIEDYAVQRGVVQHTESAGGKRQHEVRGHWRLYALHVNENGELDPYFQWIDGHTRGDAALGVIVKTRFVEMAGGSGGVRKGYIVPDIVGRPGEIVRARRA